MSRRKQRVMPEIFGMSLMDTVSCGIGASILMMLLFVTMVEPSKPVSSMCLDCNSEDQAKKNALPVVTLILDIEGTTPLRVEEWKLRDNGLATKLRPFLKVRSTSSPLTQNSVRQRVIASFYPVNEALEGHVYESQTGALTLNGSALPETLDFLLNLKNDNIGNVLVTATVITMVSAVKCIIDTQLENIITLKRNENTYQLADCRTM